MASSSIRGKSSKSSSGSEWISHTIFTACAALVIVIMAAIFIFIGAHAYQTFTVNHITFGNFFFSSNWDPTDGNFAGSEAIIPGTLVTTLLALLLATPLSVGLSLFATDSAPPSAL